MKRINIILVLFLITISACLSCSYNIEDTKEDFQSEKTVDISHIKNTNELEGFKNELSEFKDFSHQFFETWKAHIENTEKMLARFNNQDISIMEKERYARELEKKYGEFRTRIEILQPPEVAIGAYDLALAAIDQRILFFSSFHEGADIDRLLNIENEAYILEERFWQELDKVYDHFILEAERLGLTNNDDFKVSDQ